MEPLWTGIAGRIEGILKNLKTPLIVTGLIVLIAGYFATRSIAPDQIGVQVVIGVLGIDFLIFGLVFNTINLIERGKRPGYVIALFSIFSAVTIIILGMVIYLLVATTKMALLPVPPMSVGEKGSVIPLPNVDLVQMPHSTDQLEAEQLQKREGRTELEHLGFGWKTGYPTHSTRKPRYVRFKSESGISFQIGGFVWVEGAMGRFSVVASHGAPYTIEKLYVKLHKYAECPLRDEHNELLAPSAFPGYAFFVSKDVNLYEIVPRTKLGEVANWKLENDQYDEFQIRFEYEPYVLFIVSVEADTIRRQDGTQIHLSTPLLPLIKVSNGNAGGCLRLSNWYSPSILKSPQQRAYSSLVGDLALYQILSSDSKLDRNFLKGVVDTTLEEQLQMMLSKLVNISDHNKENSVFRENVMWLQKLMAWKATNPDIDPP